MEMLQCQFILSSLLVLNGCFYEVSCQTVYTYTSKEAELLPCTKAAGTVAVTWLDIVNGSQVRVLEYSIGDPPTVTVSPLEKYENFRYTLDSTSFNLVIRNVEDEDGGRYTCAPVGIDLSTIDVTVEVLAKPTVQYELQDVDELEVIVGTSYDLTCSAAGARSVSNLNLMWDPSLVDKGPLIITPNGGYMDYSITSTYTAVKGVSSITCQLSGYVMQDEINDQRMENISHTVNLNVRYAPECSLTIQEGEDCRNITLTCNCDAAPADITRYLFFDGSSEIYDGANNMFTLSVAYGTLSSFTCSAANSIGPGNKTDAKDHECDEATESTTEKSESTTTKKPDPDFPVWAIILIIVVALGCCGGGGAVIICWCKPGEDDSKPSDDKLDDNGAGPRGDPEIPAYGVVDKNRTKDPTPAPRSSMRDSKNPSNPKQDGPMEMQYADLDHGNKPASDEVRKPKEEPTEYATVQSVIV